MENSIALVEPKLTPAEKKIIAMVIDGFPSENSRRAYQHHLQEFFIWHASEKAMFPSDEAVFKILYLALRNISKRWTMPIANWSGAMNQFAIIFENRLPSGSLTNSPFTQSF